MNNRVYGGGSGSSNKGSGVQRNSLMQTRIQLADRKKPSGRTSYTAMSRQMNGRAVIVNTGSSGCCQGTQKMTTAEKIAMFNAIATTGLALAKGIGDLVGAGKANKTTKQSDIAKLNQQGNTKGTDGTGNTTSTGNASLSSTLTALAPDIDLTNIDYEAKANEFSSKMKNAKNSQDLYQALQGAKAYKAQVSSRMSGINIAQLKTDLAALKGDAEGSVKAAKEDLSKAKDGVKNAESDVKQVKQQVDSARDSYDAAKGSIKTDNKAYNEASKTVNDKTKEFDTAGKALQQAKSDYSQAQGITRDCEQSLATAKTNTSQALANLNALKGQQGFGTDGAALQAQIADAQARYDAALEAEKQAESALKDAKTQEQTAKEKLGDDSSGAVQAFNNAKTALSEARNGLKTAAENLKNSKEITQEQFELLTNRQESAQKAEDNLASKQDAVAQAQDKQAQAQDKLDQVEAQKDKLEMQIHDYEEMEKASKQLGDLSQFETKLEEMMKKEKTDRDELQRKLDEQDTISNNGTESAKGRRKAEGQEKKLTGKIVDIDSGSAIDDIARDAALNIGNKASMMSQTNTHKADPFAKMNDMAKQAEQSQNEAQLNLLKTIGFAQINGKTITKMPAMGDSASYMVDGKTYSFEELQKAVQDGTL